MSFSRQTNPFVVLLTHSTLLSEFTRREILGRYKGASIGMMWSVITPFFMLLVYTLAFGFILRSHWPGSNSTIDFALILFVGISIHGFFAECFVRAPTLIVGNPNFVKRVVFPLEILSCSVVLSAFFHLVANLFVLIMLKYLVSGSLSTTTFLFPIVLIPLFLFVLGLTWVVSALGVYIRDIGQFVGVISTAVLFLSSAIIPVDSVPEKYRILFMLNPLSPVINEARNVLLWSRWPDWQGLGIHSVFSFLVFLFGFWFFQRMRGGFADVM